MSQFPSVRTTYRHSLQPVHILNIDYFGLCLGVLPSLRYQTMQELPVRKVLLAALPEFPLQLVFRVIEPHKVVHHLKVQTAFRLGLFQLVLEQNNHPTSLGFR